MPTPADVSGTYDLTSLRTLGNLGGGGAGLPVTFTDGGGSSLRFESGYLELLADGSYYLEVEAGFKANRRAIATHRYRSLVSTNRDN